VVTSTLIFHHLSTMAKRAALAEVHRVVRPGGRFLLADFGKPRSALQWALLRGIGRCSSCERSPYGEKGPSHHGGRGGLGPRGDWLIQPFCGRWPGCRR
jgi:hypothetical protein